MLHHFHPATNAESSRKETYPHAYICTFTWVISVLFVTLLASGTRTAPLAAQASSSMTVPLLKVMPKQVGIPGDGSNCKGVLPNGTSVCHVRVSETVSSSEPIHWSTRSDFPAKFSPSSGDLSPGQSVQVTITTKFCGGYTHFYFVGPHNVATVRFQCG